MHERTANLLGAASLAVTDVVLAGVPDTAGVSPSGAAALIVLAHDPELGVTELGRRVGLSQSAAARMVDGLQAAGLVERLPAAGRVVRVRPTPAGRAAARAMLAARDAPLARVLAGLDDGEREMLAALLGKLLGRLYDEIGDADVMCRLCDRTCCTDGAVCPVGEADRRARGAT
ncbi:MarR family winged helix-turn-helix transcriptional regulator [Actinomadura algeriensis]|uniref:DNA-binding MarR family transcriptional regulator n=1 Tax=Actinomadura algeriensis TaxID=1679523 RepID=A0ABR9JJ96_9ACTN|nr:MarR family winged helix-turn-helix transcriptional regulator [Actinomadura algeriensis]MBE1530461.1 DNA-binding MarR family transcriptional regulator [Actinomadura algeriensis]